MNIRWVAVVAGLMWLVTACAGPTPTPTVSKAEPQQPTATETKVTQPTATMTAEPQPTATATAVTGAGAQATLIPADAQEPAAGICAQARGEWADIEIREDVPSPRCLQVLASQRLRVKNGTTKTITVRLGSQELEIKPGAQNMLDRPLGAILAPGIHRLQGMPFGSPEIWLRPPTPASTAVPSARGAAQELLIRELAVYVP